MLAAMTRLAKDGDQAPNIFAHIEHARMAANAFALFQDMELWGQHRNFDIHEAAGAYSGIFDDLDARTRPSTWSERSVKTYVTVGIFGDLLHELSRRNNVFLKSVDKWSLGQSEWALAYIGPEIARDEQLAARLSLWARRVAGEVLGLVRSTLFTHPELVEIPEARDEIVDLVTKLHGERMKELSLKP
ncbi:MAG: tRNA 2-methylthio-N6-isopentenyl adenosine(37) hydroxylase MiaE-like protein [Actinobacteria bacterium]|nr:MAG: tRNA 2-methylthio-N6-isopentenyl adenosine(37) hydroxylase MiaE-like protein [Actinomycetota bacterium]